MASHIRSRTATNLRVSAPTRVMLAIATRLYREGLEIALELSDQVTVVGRTRRTSEIAALTKQVAAQVMLLDIDMPGSFEAIEEVLALTLPPKIVALSVPDRTKSALRCAEAGVSGFVTHDGSVDDLLDTIKSACSGEFPCSPRVAAAMVKRLSSLSRKTDPLPNIRCLTQRELEVIRLIGRGLSNKAIARQLAIQLPTVKNHVHNILEKLHVHCRGEAAALLRGTFVGW